MSQIYFEFLRTVFTVTIAFAIGSSFTLWNTRETNVRITCKNFLEAVLEVVVMTGFTLFVGLIVYAALNIFDVPERLFPGVPGGIKTQNEIHQMADVTARRAVVEEYQHIERNREAEGLRHLYLLVKGKEAPMLPLDTLSEFDAEVQRITLDVLNDSMFIRFIGKAMAETGKYGGHRGNNVVVWHAPWGDLKGDFDFGKEYISTGFYWFSGVYRGDDVDISSRLLTIGPREGWIVPITLFHQTRNVHLRTLWAAMDVYAGEPDIYYEGRIVTVERTW